MTSATKADVQYRLKEAEGWIIVGGYERAAELTSEAAALLRALCARLAREASE